jgi:hypothetical protein
MQYGNITLHAAPKDRPREVAICTSCGRECEEIDIDNSFDDHFGTVTSWDRGSDCCEAECKEKETGE